MIGARISPDLAVEGFHSYAGWLFFTLLALGLMAAVQATPWLHRPAAAAAAPAAAPRLRADPLAARILPFVAFMLAGVAAGAFFVPADLGYPLKAVVLALAVALFWPAIREMPWRVDPAAAAAGAGVGVLWLALAPAGAEPALAAALAALPGWAMAGWAVARLVGTVALVPLVEELFFRGYVLARLDRGGAAMRALAVAVSTAAFATLHGQWLAAGIAGAVFAAVMLWRGRVTDAVVAHIVANAVVGGVALLRGDWAVI
jgi:exosortase E/protease (VPEID-CTERM system)